MDKLTLARTYEPVLRFSKDLDGQPENFFPMSVDHYIGQSRLFRKEQGAVNDKPTLETLGKMRPVDSNDFYLAFAADSIIKEDPSFLDRFKHGGLTFYGVEGEIESYMAVDSEESFSFAMEDPGLQPAVGEINEGMSFDGSLGESLFKIVDLPTRLPATIQDEALKKYKPFLDFNKFSPIYYYHVMPIRGFMVIQYWFFYAYNDWGTSHNGVNDHEGDWESIFVFLQNGAPVYTAYAAHDGPPLRHEWEDPDRQRINGDHPLVFVGCGSHASYAHSDVHTLVGLVKDYHRGDSGMAIGPGTGVSWGKPVDLAESPWALNFAGGWGALLKRLGTDLFAPGMQAPTGPVWHYDQWESPVDWAEISG
jgi:hypothetical protein